MVGWLNGCTTMLHAGVFARDKKTQLMSVSSISNHSAIQPFNHLILPPEFPQGLSSSPGKPEIYRAFPSLSHSLDPRVERIHFAALSPVDDPVREVVRRVLEDRFIFIDTD